MLLNEIKRERPKGSLIRVLTGYHITTKDQLSNIMSTGLKPASSDAWSHEQFFYANRAYFFSRPDRVTLYRIIGLMLSKTLIHLPRDNTPHAERVNNVISNLVLIRANLTGIPVYLDPSEIKEGVPSFFAEITIDPSRLTVANVDLKQLYLEFSQQFNQHVNTPAKSKGRPKNPFTNKQYKTTMNRIKRL